METKNKLRELVNEMVDYDIEKAKKLMYLKKKDFEVINSNKN